MQGLVFFFLLVTFSAVLASDPNAHIQYQGPIYELSFLEDPAADHVAKEMVGYEVDGVGYTCTIPRLPGEKAAGEEEKEGEVGGGGEESGKKNLPSSSGQSMDPAFLLAPLKVNACLYRMEGYWTYEFCFGKHVRQFHEQQEYFLGFFDAKQSSPEPHLDSKMITQRYVDGTPCDLTGKGRSVEVRFLCNPKNGGITFVGELQEPATCQYAVSVFTPIVCAFVGGEVVAKTKPTIYCNPDKAIE